MSIFSSDKPSSESGHINVIAEFKTRPGKEAEVRTMLSALVEPTRKEDGCKSYHLLEAKHTAGTFVTYEEWTGEDKLQVHLDGVKDKLEQAKPLLDGEPKITIFNHLL